MEDSDIAESGTIEGDVVDDVGAYHFSGDVTSFVTTGSANLDFQRPDN